ncbi:hypothetical protein LNV09_07470 [Paucibacter sp. B2R-40]|uniref:hypothetical protein n=1 Tax=Paucibacter sp. B2R-40 TaxID=2893554 RepID=UPI0021E45C08|nr:hypothetical protein [Paucibacter sp. B2R-40]MCV2354004.1 hypothetical protein [Paucibacter sp. B2R-40]
MSANLVIDFRTYPAGHVMKTSFAIASQRFDAIGGAAGHLMVHARENDIGLGFDSAGLRIQLSKSFDQLELKVGSFAEPVTLSALDAMGTLLHQQQIQPPNKIVAVALNVPGVRTLELTGGTNEGTLFELAAYFSERDLSFRSS